LICAECNLEKKDKLDFDNAIVNPVLYYKFVKPKLEEKNE